MLLRKVAALAAALALFLVLAAPASANPLSCAETIVGTYLSTGKIMGCP